MRSLSSLTPRWISRTSVHVRSVTRNSLRSNMGVGLLTRQISLLNSRRALGLSDIPVKCCVARSSRQSRATRLAYLPARKNAGLSRPKPPPLGQSGLDTLARARESLNRRSTKRGLLLLLTRFRPRRISRLQRDYKTRTSKPLPRWAGIKVNTMYLRQSITGDMNLTGPQRLYLNWLTGGVRERSLLNLLPIKGPWLGSFVKLCSRPVATGPLRNS